MAIEETAAAVAGGRLYVMGGFNAAGSSLDGVYVFDGSTWSAGPRLPVPVDHASAATLDGAVYIAGGHSNGTDVARAFRLDGDRWTAVASMHFARGGHALVAAEGRLYAIGGNTARANVPGVEAYDPGADAWTVVGSLPVPRNHLSGFVQGTMACVAGGRSPTTARVDCYDTITGAWSRLADLPQASSGGGATTFLGGDVLVMGGQDASETRIVSQLTHYRADNSWSSGDSMLSPRHGFELAVGRQYPALGDQSRSRLCAVPRRLRSRDSLSARPAQAPTLCAAREHIPTCLRQSLHVIVGLMPAIHVFPSEGRLGWPGHKARP